MRLSLLDLITLPEYVIPPVAFKEATSLLSHFFLLIKDQNFLGLLVGSGLIVCRVTGWSGSLFLLLVSSEICRASCCPGFPEPPFPSPWQLFDLPIYPKLVESAVSYFRERWLSRVINKCVLIDSHISWTLLAALQVDQNFSWKYEMMTSRILQRQCHDLLILAKLSIYLPGMDGWLWTSPGHRLPRRKYHHLLQSTVS